MSYYAFSNIGPVVHINKIQLSFDTLRIGKYVSSLNVKVL